MEWYNTHTGNTGDQDRLKILLEISCVCEVRCIVCIVRNVLGVKSVPLNGMLLYMV